MVTKIPFLKKINCGGPTVLQDDWWPYKEKGLRLRQNGASRWRLKRCAHKTRNTKASQQHQKVRIEGQGTIPALVPSETLWTSSLNNWERINSLLFQVIHFCLFFDSPRKLMMSVMITLFGELPACYHMQSIFMVWQSCTCFICLTIPQ